MSHGTLTRIFAHVEGDLVSTNVQVGQRPLVVLPTYNERDNIAGIVASIRSQLPRATIWIVDDSSPDGTGSMADELARADPFVAVIHRTAKQGLGTAYVEAYRKGLSMDFDSFLQMDADFSHDPAYLPSMLAALENADLVLGSRYVAGGGTRNWSRLRQIISQGGNLVARIGLDLRTKDATGGFRAFRRSTIEKLCFDDLRLRGYGFQVEVIFQVERMGMRVEEIPIIFVERVAGTSKMSKAIVLEACLHIARRRFAMWRDRSRGEQSGVVEVRGEAVGAAPKGNLHD